MAIKGRKPKPLGQSRNQNKPRHDWTDVFDAPFKSAPKLPAKMPNGDPWPDAVRRWWAVVAAMPHCTLWADSDWQFGFDTAYLKAIACDSPTASMAAEIRNRERVLGTTAEYRRDQRIRYVDHLPVTPELAAVPDLENYREL